MAVGLLAAALAGCSEDNPLTPGEELVGTWEVTSFEGEGFPELIAAGMSITLTLTASAYSILIENDIAELCDGATSCTETGVYTASDTQITLDPGTQDEETFSYSIQGSTMTWTGDIDGTPVTIRLMKQ